MHRGPIRRKTPQHVGRSGQQSGWGRGFGLGNENVVDATEILRLPRVTQLCQNGSTVRGESRGHSGGGSGEGRADLCGADATSDFLYEWRVKALLSVTFPKRSMALIKANDEHGWHRC